MQRLLVLLEREIEAAVPVRLGGSRVALDFLVVEGVLVSHVDLLGVRLDNDLQGEDVVDVGSLEHERAGAVDRVLVALGNLERRIRGVLVDGDHVQVGLVALVNEDLVAPLCEDQIPRVDGLGGAHEHREHVVGGEDGGLVLVGELLHDGVAGGGDVVGGALEDLELALRRLRTGLLVVAAVVVVQEAVVVEVLALASLEVELAETREVDLLLDGPVGLDLDGRVAVALGLVVPAAKATSTASTTTAAAVVVAALSSTAANALEGASPTALCLSAPRAAASTEDCAAASPEAAGAG